jgi:hypothetical protein
MLKKEQAKGWDCIGQNGPSAGALGMWSDPKAFAWSWYESDPGCKCDNARTKIEKAWCHKRPNFPKPAEYRYWKRTGDTFVIRAWKKARKSKPQGMMHRRIKDESLR